VNKAALAEARAADDADRGDHGFREDLLAALSVRPRAISPKYFYDAAGSALFDRICELPEYYPTRTEWQILRERAADIAGLIGPRAQLIEFGAGSMNKVRLLLDALQDPAAYVPIDISGEHLAQAALTLRRDYPGLRVQPLVADYTRPLVMPALEPGAGRRRGFFPGSTIGNFSAQEALRFLRHAARQLRGGALLLGADLVKDPAILHAAYNDSQGVTAAFNLNILARAQRELQAGIDLAQFRHSAFYNSPLQRIEMHLLSRRRQRITLDGRSFEFEEGETLHTENSCKFTIDGLRALARQAGFEPGPVWTDPQHLFSLHWLIAPAT
jgi:dimethylhistidine N-methyltransferase